MNCGLNFLTQEKHHEVTEQCQEQSRRVLSLSWGACLKNSNMATAKEPSLKAFVHIS